MKLHLPSTLRKALLACLAAFALPVSLPVTVGSGALISFLAAQHAAAAVITTETTTYNGIIYSGKIYTISENSSFHEATFSQLMMADGGTGVYGPFKGTESNRDLRFNDEGQNTPSYNFWENVWCNGAATAGVGSRFGQTLRFDGSDILEFRFTFNPLRLGGIITADGLMSGEYILNGDGNGRVVEFQASDNASSVKINLQSSFLLKSTALTSANFRSDTEWILSSGKSLTFENYNVVTDAEKSIRVRRSDAEAGGAAATVLLKQNLTLGANAELSVRDGVNFELLGSLESAGSFGITSVNGANIKLGDISSQNRENGLITITADGGSIDLGNVSTKAELTSSNGGSISLNSLVTNSSITVADGGSATIRSGVTLNDYLTATVKEGGTLNFDGETRVDSDFYMTDVLPLSMEQNSTVNFNDDASISNMIALTVSGKRGSINFNKDATINGRITMSRGGTVTVRGNAIFGTASNLVFENGGSLIVHGQTTINSYYGYPYGSGQVILNPGNSMELRGGLAIGYTSELVLAGGNLLVGGVLNAIGYHAIRYSSGSSLHLDTTRNAILRVSSDTFYRTSGDVPLDIVLDGAVFDLNWSYRLIDSAGLDSDSMASIISHLYFNSGNIARGFTLELGLDGWVNAMGTQKSLDIVWQGKGLGMTWQNGTDNWLVDDLDKRFHPMDSVSFIGTDDVVIMGTVVVSDMRVTGEYSFTSGSVNVLQEGALTIAGESIVSFKDVNLTTPVIEVKEGAELALEVGEDVIISAPGGLHLEEGASVSVSGVGTKIFTDSQEQPGVTLAAGSTLRVENVDNWTGRVQGEGTLELANGGLDVEAPGGFREDEAYNTLDDAHLGVLLGGEELGKLRLVDSTLLQLNTANTELLERLGSIRELEVTEGSVFLWRAASSIGTEDSVLRLEGDGQVENAEGKYRGALQIGAFSTGEGAGTFRLRSKVELTGDATVYVHGTPAVEPAEGEEGEAQAEVIHSAVLDNLFKANNHTLTKTGLGRLVLDEGFRTYEKVSEGEPEVGSGKIEVTEGTLVLNYGESDVLGAYELGTGDDISSGAVVLGGRVDSNVYNLSTLSGAGSLSMSDEMEAAEIRFDNSYEEKQVGNTYSGAFDSRIVMHVVGGYQAIASKEVKGELVMLATDGGTLDLEELTLAEGAGNALHLTAGTKGTPATVDSEEVPGTPGTLVINGYRSPVNTTIDVTLYSGSELSMTNAHITNSGELDVDNLALMISGSTADLSGLIVDGFNPATGDTLAGEEGEEGTEPVAQYLTRVNITLQDGGKLFMSNSELFENVQLYITAADASLANLSGMSGWTGVTINPRQEDSDGEQAPDLTGGSVLDLSSARLGEKTTINVLAAEESRVVLSGVNLSERSRVNIDLISGATADLTYLSTAPNCTVSITAENGSVNLDGAMLDSAPGGEYSEELSGVGLLELDLHGGTHSLANMTFGEKVMFTLNAYDNAYVTLTRTSPITGVKLFTYGTEAVVEGLEVGYGSQVIAMDGVLNLAGQNIIHLHSEMDKMENSIFSDLTLNLLEGAKLQVDVTGVLSEVLADVGRERTYYISEGDLTSWGDKLTFGAELALLNVTWVLGEDGSITFRALEVNPDTIYVASRDNINQGSIWNDGGGDIYASTNEKVAVFIDRDTVIDLRGKSMGTKVDGLVLKNLIGAPKSDLVVKGDGTGKSKITLSNSFGEVSLKEMEQALEELKIGKIDHDKITFSGNITLESTDLQISHRDGESGAISLNSTTLVKGTLRMTSVDGKKSTGALTMTSGTLELESSGNDLGRVGISFAGHDARIVLYGDTVVGGEISVTESNITGEDAPEEHVELAKPTAAIVNTSGDEETGFVTTTTPISAVSATANDATREDHILLGKPQVVLTLADGARVNAGVVIGNQLLPEEEEPAEGEELPEPGATPDASLGGGAAGEAANGEEEEPVEIPREPLLAGTVSVAAGSQKMESGRLTLDLSGVETEDGSPDEHARLVVEAGARLNNVTLNLEAGSVLTVVGKGEQDPLPEEEGELAPQADSAVEDALAAANVTVESVPSDWLLAGLTGEGKLASTVEHLGGIEICVAGGDKRFSGDLSEYRGTVVVVGSDGTQHFDGVTGGKGWNLTNAKGGRVAFNLMEGAAPNSLTMGNLTLKSGSLTTILFDMSEGSQAYLNFQGLTIEDEAEVTLGQYEGSISLPGQDGEKVARLLGTINVENVDLCEIGDKVIWHLRGIRNASVSKVYVKPNGDIYLESKIDNTNRLAAYADSENAAVGAALIWGIQNTHKLGGDLAAIDSWLYSKLVDQKKPSKADIAQANHIMAALAGASTAVMGSAVSTDMERQLREIRNRTTTLSYSGDSFSPLHSSVWLNAESSFHKQDADASMPGFKLNGWGGTVGAHTQVSSTSTIGLAITAMYSDLESVGGADVLKGDMDTYYLSAFAQVAHEAWRHTFVMSVSMADVDVTRSVNYGEGAYTTKGSTDGLTFGALYEVGYTMPLNVDYSVCLQPVLNVAWRMGQLGAYTESGATNAGLHVEEQTFNSITLGAGARVQAAFGASLWNRTGLLEARALVKAEVGDRQGESSVSLQNASLYRGKVKAAEIGAVGVELGAGVTVPTGLRSEVFADFSADLRSGYTNMNATVGYKISF